MASDDSAHADPLLPACQEIQRLLVAVTKSANKLPIADFPFLNTFRSFDDHMKRRKSQILSLIADLMKNHTSHSRSFLRASDDEERFDILCDFNDYLLDKVSNSLDDAEGLKKKNEALIVATLNMTKRLADDSQKTAPRDFKLLASKVVERPQLSFIDKPNNSHEPFIPKITDKPNSLKPLAILPEVLDNGVLTFSHPYEFEIEHFEPDDQDMKPVEVQRPASLESTPLHMIDSRSGLMSLIQKLKSCHEIAVDLEHHNYRSFQGFTCLIQISSRNEDFIIDALKLRSELSVLNEVFTDPRIVKVFHGADSDVVWLQKDFGVYLVNLFDTFQASKTLGLVHHSLAYLLKLYCGIDADKHYQLSDWRIRPLEEEMIRYARQDTHFLLYVYDRMKNDLLSKGNASQNLLRSVIRKSSLVCLKKYEKPILDKDSHLQLIQKTNLVLNNRQMQALEQIFKWRDRVARAEDESIAYVLPNHMLLQLSQILPREIQGILACCQPTPPAVKQNLNELHLIFLKSREMPLSVVRDKKRQSGAVMQNSSSIEIHDHHDVGHEVEVLPELLEQPPIVVPRNKRVDCKDSPLFLFFARKSRAANTDISLTTPYDRLLKAVAHPPVAVDEAAREPICSTSHASGGMLEDSELRTSKRKMEVEEGISEGIRSIRQKEAAKLPEPAIVAPHEYKASDMEAFRQSRSQASGQNRFRNRSRKKKQAAATMKEARSSEPGNISYRYTAPE